MFHSATPKPQTANPKPQPPNLKLEPPLQVQVVDQGDEHADGILAMQVSDGILAAQVKALVSHRVFHVSRVARNR